MIPRILERLSRSCHGNCAVAANDSKRQERYSPVRLALIGALVTSWLLGLGDPSSSVIDRVRAADEPEPSAAVSSVERAEGEDRSQNRSAVPADVDALIKRSLSKPVTMSVSVELRRIFAGVPRGAEDLKAMQAHLRTLSERVMPCTVAIVLHNGMGSGVIVSEDGYVLTAGHVAGRAGRDVTFIMHDGRSVKGKSLGANHGIDSGLLKITAKRKWPYAEIGHSRDLANGQWCLATGHPGGYQRGRSPPLRVGRVLMQSKRVVITDCTLVGGDSGGPLFDAHGKVVGIHSRIGDEIQENLHIPIDTYRTTWHRLAGGETWGGRAPGGPYIGVVEAANANNAKIGEVLDGRAADQAGIRKGDVIVKFGDQPIADFAALVAAVGSTEPGDLAKIELRRGTETITLHLTIGRYGR